MSSAWLRRRPSRSGVPELSDLDDNGIKATARTLFGYLAPHYDAVLDYATLFQDRYWKKWLMKELRPRAGWRVLDLGCGTCVLEGQLCRAGCEVVGLDLTEEMLRAGAGKPFKCISGLVIGSAEMAPAKEDVFDAVVSCYVAKYCDTERLLAEASRCLKRTGRLVLYDFSRPRGPFGAFHYLYLHGILRLVGKALGRANPRLAFTFVNLPRIIAARRWDDNIEEQLKQHGFSDVRLERLSGGVVTAVAATLSLISRGAKPGNDGPPERE